MKALGLLAVVITGGLLLYAVDDFPRWGDPFSPASEYRVSRHYIEQAFSETSVPNMVTAVLADYRGYDTMFEAVVIFVAGMAILALLRKTPESILTPPSADAGAQPESMEPAKEAPDLIINTTCRLLIPVIQLFAFYVVAHGHHSPGGGFQGGVIFGASFILLAVTFDVPAALRRRSELRTLIVANAGLFIYAGIGLLCLVMGANFLDYGKLDAILPGSEIDARSHGILGVEIGVAFTVGAIIFIIYANLSSKGTLKEGL